MAEEAKGKTVQDVYEAMTPEQQNVVHILVGEAVNRKKAGQ